MKKYLMTVLCLLWAVPTFAHHTYGSKVCQNPENTCYQVKRGDTWGSLFYNDRERDVVRRLNRMNVELKTGQVIAIPKHLSSTDKFDIAPFPRQMPATKTNIVRVDQSKLAWGAYDENGRLINWGPISGGKSYCADVKRGCRTINGKYTIYRRQGAGCRSGKYPLPHGGARMPYCMHFHRGYALHGSTTVPGHHASHGCVRMFIEDAKWLNHNFIKVGYTKVHVTP